MPTALRIAPIAATELEALLPLIAAYQGFYGSSGSTTSATAPSSPASSPQRRRPRCARPLNLRRTRGRFSYERGAHQLQWVTAPDNDAARRLYDATDAESEPCIEYELRL